MQSFAEGMQVKVKTKFQDSIEKIKAMPQNTQTEADLAKKKADEFKLMQAQ